MLVSEAWPLCDLYAISIAWRDIVELYAVISCLLVVEKMWIAATDAAIAVILHRMVSRPFGQVGHCNTVEK